MLEIKLYLEVCSLTIQAIQRYHTQYILFEKNLFLNVHSYSSSKVNQLGF